MLLGVSLRQPGTHPQFLPSVALNLQRDEGLAVHPTPLHARLTKRSRSRKEGC